MNARMLGAVAIVAAAAAVIAAPADAAYSAKVKGKVLSITGNGAGDQLALRLRAGDPTILEVDVGDDGTADFSFARSAFTEIEVRAGGGNDAVRIDDMYGAFTDTEATTLMGEAGNDSIIGGVGAEAIQGGAGDDVITPRNGDETSVRGGPGDDTFVWNPGDDNDTLEGQAGEDTLRFFGANIGEQIELTANGERLRFTRNIASVVMDTNELELVDFRALGGADVVTVNDLAATDVTGVFVALAAAGGGGDLAADQVVVNGTAGDDTVTVSGSAGNVSVAGLAAAVAITDAEPTDRLDVNTLPGNDSVDHSGLVPGTIQLYVNGALV